MAPRTAICLIVALAACGRVPKPGATPRDTVEALQRALDTQDAGAIYDLLSREARDGLDRKLRSAQRTWPDANGQTARDFLLDAAERAAARRREPPHLVVAGVKEYGERARVRVTALQAGRERTRTITMVREAGRWHLAGDAVLGDIPLQLTPPEPDCFT